MSGFLKILRGATCLTFLALCVASASAEPVVYDLLLKGGHVIDPKNDRNGRFDVAIIGDRIHTIAEHLPAAHARKVVDVSDYIVTPGLIDLHAHYDVYRSET